MRRKARVDANQKDIRDAFLAMGCSVADTSRLGEGFPDLVVGCSGVNLLIEVKDGDKPPSARKLTESEEKFMNGWLGQYTIIETEDQVIELVNSVRRRK